MADEADRANDIAELSLANILNNSPKFITLSLAECKECGEDIPLKRQALGAVSRCVDCQNEFEKRGR
ncbi:TraR/DksA C4-type zinc finger protein [Psychrobacter sp. 72-O-c]|uniref:TraR/DksA C4-type zinc finger protein n=1 Tax=Psychrobacter sp. 72-O-c TaxID=2774125 RepID=UPI0019197C4F|nr:TraR/DksA C4-type zinc finger protein [Psychrobacter sp. 72-O-c]